MLDQLIKYLMFLRDKHRSRDPELSYNLQNQVILLLTKCDAHLENVKTLMSKYGISALPDGEQERAEFLKKYPDLQQEYTIMLNSETRVSKIMINNPWLWTPGCDVGMYYDTGALKGRMMEILGDEADYLLDLNKQMEELDKKIATTKVSNQDLENQKNYLMELMADAVATIGDRLNKEWWNAIPRIIKEKCHKYMDDLMTEVIASDNKIALYIKNYETVKDNIFISGITLKVIEEKINYKISEFAPRVNLILMSVDAGNAGVSQNTGNIFFNLPYMGKNADDFVDTLKHEVLGHHLDDHCPNFGIRGEEMSQFVDETFNTVSGKIISHGMADRDEEVIAISPLLKQHYSVPNITEKAFNKLHGEGWKFVYSQCPDFYHWYQNQIGERNAWLIGKTKNIVRKMELYRKQHGLPRIEKIH